MTEKSDGRFRALNGVIASLGVTHPKAQRMAQDFIYDGDYEIVESAVAEALLDAGLGSGRIPSPDAMPLNEAEKNVFVEAVRWAILRVIDDYATLGGVLIARDYISKPVLALEMMKLWHTKKSEPIKKTELAYIDGLSPEEFNNRFAVAAQELAELLTEKYKLGTMLMDHQFRYKAGTEDFLIEADNLEGFCTTATKLLFEAFRDPDAVKRRRAAKAAAKEKK